MANDFGLNWENKIWNTEYSEYTIVQKKKKKTQEG